jgi:hypothetical protein
MAELVYQTWQRLTGTPWSQAQKMGLTNGSASANLALQRKLLSGWRPNGTAAAAPAAPAPKTAAQIEAENQAALVAEQKRQSDLLKGVTDKQGAYAKGWGYDDVLANQNASALEGFLSGIMGVNTDSYGTGGAGQDWVGISNDTLNGKYSNLGIGDEFLKQLQISAKNYQPEWQQAIDRWKQDALEEEQAANAQYNQGVDEQATQYASNGISGGLKEAAVQNKANTGATAFGSIAKEKSRFLEDWKKKQKESLVGYAQNIRNQKIDQYNRQTVSESGMTDPGMIKTAYDYGQKLQYT